MQMARYPHSPLMILIEKLRQGDQLTCAGIDPDITRFTALGDQPLAVTREELECRLRPRSLCTRQRGTSRNRCSARLNEEHGTTDVHRKSDVVRGEEKLSHNALHGHISDGCPSQIVQMDCMALCNR